MTVEDKQRKIIKMANGSYMVFHDVAERLKLRGFTPPPKQGFMGLEVFISTPKLENYLQELYDSSISTKTKEETE